MEKICLDFEAALDFLRGDNAILEKLKYYLASENICITSFTMLFLFQSLRKPDLVTAFVNQVTVLPFDGKSAQLAAAINHELEDGPKAGSKRLEDIMTAAICISNDAFLFSRNPSRYDGIKGLRKV
ncbi:MAG: type II toxin-antitoxin system VapC family toxin [Candidatus Bilamarchaeum sp.]|jgi:predicted nucleic acid-binding protein